MADYGSAVGVVKSVPITLSIWARWRTIVDLPAPLGPWMLMDMPLLASPSRPSWSASCTVTCRP